MQRAVCAFPRSEAHRQTRAPQVWKPCATHRARCMAKTVATTSTWMHGCVLTPTNTAPVACVATPHPSTPGAAVYSERSLATLLLADLSLSTDAYATTHRKSDRRDPRRPVCVWRSAARGGRSVCGVGFQLGAAQPCALQHLKPFDEPWSDACRNAGRVPSNPATTPAWVRPFGTPRNNCQHARSTAAC
jgi:hypothetical protein